MHVSRLMFAATTAALLMAGAQAQQAPGGGPTTPAGLPEACRTASANMGQTMQGGTMQGMGQGQAMQGVPMQNLSDANRGYMEAMNKQMPAMMQGMVASDADVAFVCAMIPHHQSAVDMARVVLRYGDNPEAKKMAEKVVKDQEKEIEDLNEWLRKNVKR